MESCELLYLQHFYNIKYKNNILLNKILLNNIWIQLSQILLIIKYF
jgi:hypothetical protein